MNVPADRTDLAHSLLGTLRDERSLKDLAVSLSEVNIDTLLNGGILESIPVVRTAVSAYKSYNSYRDYLLLKKIVLFLTEFDDIPKDQRFARFSEAVDLERRENEVGENLILLLDGLNDMGKPKLVARVWSAFLNGHIPFMDLQNLQSAIDSVRTSDIPVLRDVYRGTTSPDGLELFPPWKPTSKTGVMSAPHKPMKETDRISPSIWNRINQLAFAGLFDVVHGVGGVGGRWGGLIRNDLGSDFVRHALVLQPDE